MSKIKRNFFISAILIILAIIFTILVKVVDVKEFEITKTDIGFSTFNKFIFETIGVNMKWYHITEWLGIIPIFIVLSYTLMGIIQVKKRKNIFKVDKEIIILGIFYIIIISIYIFFENITINYRPILINGFLESSYPSSHTLMTICICGSSIIINKKLFNNKITSTIDVLLLLIILITVIGRLLSGVHWFTDIIGGLFISIALLITLSSVIALIKKDNN